MSEPLENGLAELVGFVHEIYNPVTISSGKPKQEFVIRYQTGKNAYENYRKLQLFDKRVGLLEEAGIEVGDKVYTKFQMSGNLSKTNGSAYNNDTCFVVERLTANADRSVKPREQRGETQTAKKPTDWNSNRNNDQEDDINF